LVFGRRNGAEVVAGGSRSKGVIADGWGGARRLRPCAATDASALGACPGARLEQAFRPAGADVDGESGRAAWSCRCLRPGIWSRSAGLQRLGRGAAGERGWGPGAGPGRGWRDAAAREPSRQWGARRPDRRRAPLLRLERSGVGLGGGNAAQVAVAQSVAVA